MKLSPMKHAKTGAMANGISNQLDFIGLDEWAMAAINLLIVEAKRIYGILPAFTTGNGNIGTVLKAANELITPLPSWAWLFNWSVASLLDNAATIKKDPREEL